MQLVRSALEVAEIVARAKSAAPAFCTNFFPAPQRLERWIEHRELTAGFVDGVAMILRQDRGFSHLYFCAASPEMLARAAAAPGELHSRPVVVDLVGDENSLAALTTLLERARFGRYRRLLRMARTPPADTPPEAAAADGTTLAERSDCTPLLELLLRSFDVRSEQLPMPYDVEAAIENRQIRVARCDDRLAGLLFHETRGLSSMLRYWLVDPAFRARRLGSALMRRYFAEHPAVRRFVLWVAADNQDAIERYRRFGFAPDGLLDQVLANEMIRR